MPLLLHWFRLAATGMGPRLPWAVACSRQSTTSLTRLGRGSGHRARLAGMCMGAHSPTRRGYSTGVAQSGAADTPGGQAAVPDIHEVQPGADAVAAPVFEVFLPM